MIYQERFRKLEPQAIKSSYQIPAFANAQLTQKRRAMQREGLEVKWIEEGNENRCTVLFPKMNTQSHDK